MDSLELIVHTEIPFNAEPCVDQLVQFQYTPEELTYCRNHAPFPKPQDEGYSITVKIVKDIGIEEKEFSISVPALRSLFPNVSVVASLQCAGNRRFEMDETIEKLPGDPVLWMSGAIANCKFDGVRVRDVLKSIGIGENLDGLHVWFASLAEFCENDVYYGGSIPLASIMNSEDLEDTLLAFEMNDKPLSLIHGGPCRLVVPGYLGARWVKWLDTIIIHSKESPNYYHHQDYKILPPEIKTIEEASLVWCAYPAITTLPLNSVIASAKYSKDSSSVVLEGYACGFVDKVEVSADGDSWIDCEITYQEGKWSWTLWKAEVSVNTCSGMIYSRAKNSLLKLQAEIGTWNIRGFAYDAWGHIEWK